MTPPPDPAPYAAMLRRRLGIVKRLQSVSAMAAAHAGLVEEAARRGEITRSEAIEELEWLRGATIDIDALVRRSGARLPPEGTGVMQH